MIGLILAFASVGATVPGCHSAGAKVVCELDPPAPAPKPAPPAAKPVVLASITHVRPVRAEGAPRAVRTAKLVVPPARTAPPPPSGEEIQRRLASLVSIGDCTGARTYGRSVGATQLADGAFTACAGMANAPKLSYALDIPPRPPAVEAETNDAIIDQIPEMP